MWFWFRKQSKCRSTLIWLRPYGVQALLREGKLLNTFSDKGVWFLETSGSFTIKSLVIHLSMASPNENALQRSLWKTKCLKRVNVWKSEFCFSITEKTPASIPLSFTHTCPLFVSITRKIFSTFFWLSLCCKLVEAAAAIIQYCLRFLQ